MALDDLLDEHEQGQRVQRWLRDNAAGILGGVLLAVILVGGWQWWQKQRLTTLNEAHRQYQLLAQRLQADDLNLDEAAQEVTALRSGNAAIYADLAALHLARAQVRAQRYNDAISSLRAIQAPEALTPLVEQRLARLLIETGQASEALTVLGTLDDALSLEIRADALFAQQAYEAASEVYRQALIKIDGAAPQRRLLDVKLMEALAVSNKTNLARLPIEANAPAEAENNG